MGNFYVQLLVNGIIAGSVYAMFAVGLSMVYGVFKFINFSHGELITWGAYLTLMFFSPPFGLPVWLAAIPALAITIVIAIVQDILVYKPLRLSNPIAVLIASIGLSFLLRNAIRLFWGSDLRTFDLPLAEGMAYKGVYITRVQVLMVISALAFFTLLYLLLKKTILGKSLRAVSDNMELSAIMGINMKKVTRTVWVLSALFAGAGGILLALDTSLEPMMGTSNLIKAFAAVLMGGAGNIWGALLGGLFIGIAENMGMAFIPSDYKDFIAFGMIILLLLFKPRGLFSIVGGVR